MTDVFDAMLRNKRAEGQAAAEANQLAEEYRQVDRVALSKLPDKALAEWQGAYPPGSAQFILAEYEWQRRLMAQQVRSMQFATWLTLAGVVLGAVLTYGFSKLSSDSKPFEPTQNTAADKHTCNDAIQTTANTVKTNAISSGNPASQPAAGVNLKH